MSGVKEADSIPKLLASRSGGLGNEGVNGIEEEKKDYIPKLGLGNEGVKTFLLSVLVSSW